MMVPIIFLIMLFIGLVIATIRDLQIREVPDTVSYGLIVVGLLGGLMAALLLHNLQFFLERVYGFLIGVLVGMIMFFLRQWGGGDAKLIAGVGAILGFSFSNLQLADFLILLIFCGAFYGILYTLYLALVKHRSIFLPKFKEHLRTKHVHRLRIGLVATGVLCIIMIFLVPMQLKLLLGFMMLSLYLLVYSWIFMKVVEQTIMMKEYPVEKLTEGDWIVQDVKVKGKLIISKKNTGVTIEQIKQLKKANVKQVLVKEGIPFVPGFLLAFIVLIFLQLLGMPLWF